MKEFLKPQQIKLAENLYCALISKAANDEVVGIAGFSTQADCESALMLTYNVLARLKIVAPPPGEKIKLVTKQTLFKELGLSLELLNDNPPDELLNIKKTSPNFLSDAVYKFK